MSSFLCLAPSLLQSRYRKSTDTNPADWSPCVFWSVSESVFPTRPCEGNVFNLHLKAIHAYFLSILFVYFWQCWVFLAEPLSLAAASAGYSLVITHGPLAARAARVAEAWLQNAGSLVAACGHSCSSACGSFPGWGSNLCPLHWQADS